MRILIITSCTGEKAEESDQALTLEDFQLGSKHIAKREKQLADQLTEAEQLYTGQQHVRLMRGVADARDKSIDVDVWVLSAGYGLVPGNQKLAPYECTFQGMKAKELRDWADKLNIPEDFQKVVGEKYDLGLILLGDTYLKACNLDQDLCLGGATLLMCGTAMKKRLPEVKNLHPIAVSNPEAKRFSCGLVGLKGELAARILSQQPDFPTNAGKLPDRDSLLDRLDNTKSKKMPKRKGPIANPAVDRVIDIPKSWQDKPHRSKLKYFIPEWDDLVDPDYDFINDEHSGGTGDWCNQVYAHQMYPAPNYDGILVSRVVAEKSKKKKERINRLGVHRFLRVPRDFPVMGDCGAFGYINDETPPYTTEDVLDYYTRLDFDAGVSVDHLIVSSTSDSKKYRYELTIHNAEEFITEHQRRDLSWTPIGAVQGWDPESYAKAADSIVKCGYDYIALGGLVRSTTKDILQVAQAVRDTIPSKIKVHLFGVARLNAISKLSTIGIDSVDSASCLRQAWMRVNQSYLLGNESYAAIRIPEAGKSYRAKQMLDRASLSESQVVQLEKTALHMVRAYAVNRESMQSCLEALLEYDQHVTSNRVDMEEAYRRTLTERPWDQCSCPICGRDKVEVIIFRGNNRNRRRGFHNTHNFYEQFQTVVTEDEVETMPLFPQPSGVGV